VMIAPGIGLIHLGLYQLYSISATVGALTFGMPGWGLASRGLIAGVTICFVAAVIWWWPEKTADASRTRQLSQPIGDTVR
jgi:hypothetical protein